MTLNQPMNRAALAVLSAAIFSSPGSAQELLQLGERPPCLTAPTAEGCRLTPSSVAAIEERVVTVDLELLASKAPFLDLSLLDGETYRVEWIETDARAPGRFTWRGEIRGDGGEDGGDVTLTAHDGLLVGRISTAAAVYVIQPRPGGGHTLSKLDETRFPPCAGGQEPEILLTSETVQDSDSDKARKLVTVLGLYTGAARNGAGGKTRIEALIRGAVDVTNTGFQRSRVNARLRLVHTAQIDLPERFNLSQSLSEMRLSPEINALRNRWNADLVAAIYERATSCGIGYVMRNPGQSFAPWAYSITVRSCAVGNMTFPHEVGHNLGLEHNPENSSATPSSASFPWSFAHWVDGRFRTIMSYSEPCVSGCPRRANYSNPDIRLNSLPTGIRDQRDNHRSLKNTAGIAEQFRSEELVADFNWLQGEPRIHAPVTFFDASTGRPTSWLWDFGDGSASEEANPTHTYAEIGVYTVSLTVANGSKTESLSQQIEVLDNRCLREPSTLCLSRERFQVQVAWRDFDDNVGNGTLAPAGSEDSGLFWFFAENNWEILVKVLDACGFNDRFWVFAAATTNVEYTLRVTDTLTGFVSEYFNPLGNSADAIADTSAFATCSASAGAAAARSRLERPRLSEPGAASGCGDGTDHLCLNRGRFRAEVEWRKADGETGVGSAVPFGTDDSGLFWFFDEDNWEMLVKVLDGCGANDRFWVFSAATTDVEYTLRITDTATGNRREYYNFLGDRAPAVTDIEAFATCP